MAFVCFADSTVGEAEALRLRAALVAPSLTLAAGSVGSIAIVDSAVSSLFAIGNKGQVKTGLIANELLRNNRFRIRTRDSGIWNLCSRLRQYTTEGEKWE